MFGKVFKIFEISSTQKLSCYVTYRATFWNSVYLALHIFTNNIDLGVIRPEAKSNRLR